MSLRTPIGHLDQIERLYGSILALTGIGNETIRRHHHTEQPVGVIAAPDADNHADIGSRNLGENFGREVFDKTVGIGRRLRLWLDSHSHVLPALFVAQIAKGKTCTALTYVASELSSHPTFYGDLRAQVVVHFSGSKGEQ